MITVLAAQTCKPMTAAEMDKLRAQVAPTKVQLERFLYHRYDTSRV